MNKMTKYMIVPTLKSLSKEIEVLSSKLSDYQSSEAIKASDFMLDEELLHQLSNIKKKTDAQVKSADRKFTLAIVGEFKAGKSTLINALLGLKEGQRLSTQDSPDTACSVLILNKQEDDDEACIVMKDGSKQNVSWEEAKNLTSQVYRDKNPSKYRYDDIEEIEYYINNELLNVIAINDLPGTGSRYYATHTEAARTKMLEADAILWVIPGNKEPDASTRKDLMILSTCAQRVIPVVNIFEDLTKTPPLQRDEAEIQSVLQVLEDEWSDFFDATNQKPICVSAKMLEIESTKPNPDPDVLVKYGHDNIFLVINSIMQRAEDIGDTIRVKRLKAVGLDLIGKTNNIIAQFDSSLISKNTKLKSTESEYAARKDDMNDIRSHLKNKIREIAKSKSNDICEIVFNQGKNFVEQTLQVSNVPDLTKAMLNKKKLNDELQMRFINSYLKLNEKPNWLDELMINYAEDVKSIVIPEWKSFMRRAIDDDFEPGKVKVIDINWDNLAQSLMHAVFATIQRVLGIGTLAALLFIIPGGQVIDAIIFGIVIMVASFTDPLAKERHIAVQRVYNTVKAQEYEIQNRLLAAGVSGNDYIANQINNFIYEESNKTKNAIDELSKLRNALRDTRTNLETIVEALNI